MSYFDHLPITSVTPLPTSHLGSSNNNNRIAQLDALSGRAGGGGGGVVLPQRPAAASSPAVDTMSPYQARFAVNELRQRHHIAQSHSSSHQQQQSESDAASPPLQQQRHSYTDYAQSSLKSPLLLTTTTHATSGGDIGTAVALRSHASAGSMRGPPAPPVAVLSNAGRGFAIDERGILQSRVVAPARPAAAAAASYRGAPQSTPVFTRVESRHQNTHGYRRPAEPIASFVDDADDIIYVTAKERFFGPPRPQAPLEPEPEPVVVVEEPPPVVEAPAPRVWYPRITPTVFEPVSDVPFVVRAPESRGGIDKPPPTMSSSLPEELQTLRAVSPPRGGGAARKIAPHASGGGGGGGRRSTSPTGRRDRSQSPPAKHSAATLQHSGRYSPARLATLNSTADSSSAKAPRRRTPVTTSGSGSATLTPSATAARHSLPSAAAAPKLVLTSAKGGGTQARSQQRYADPSVGAASVAGLVGFTTLRGSVASRAADVVAKATAAAVGGSRVVAHQQLLQKQQQQEQQATSFRQQPSQLQASSSSFSHIAQQQQRHQRLVAAAAAAAPSSTATSTTATGSAVATSTSAPAKTFLAWHALLLSAKRDGFNEADLCRLSWGSLRGLLDHFNIENPLAVAHIQLEWTRRREEMMVPGSARSILDLAVRAATPNNRTVTLVAKDSSQRVVTFATPGRSYEYYADEVEPAPEADARLYRQMPRAAISPRRR